MCARPFPRPWRTRNGHDTPPMPPLPLPAETAMDQILTLNFTLLDLLKSKSTLTSFIYMLFLRATTKSPLPFLWWQPEWCQQYSVWQESNPLCLWRTGGCLWPHLWCPYLKTKYRGVGTVRQCVTELITGCTMCYDVCMSFSIQIYLWGERRTSYPDTAHEISAPTQSLAWETLQTENTHIHIEIHMCTPPAGNFYHPSQKRSPHVIIGLNKRNKHWWIF